MPRIHYDILQIKPGATSEEIQHAYRKQALRYHPDRNPAPDAAARMAAINEAYEVLSDPSKQNASPGLESGISKVSPTDNLTFSIRSAARAVIVRNGWIVTHEDDRVTVFEIGREHVRIILTDRLTNDSLLRLSRQYREVAAVLTVHIDGPIAVRSRTTVIDLMRAERHGASISDGPCKSLLSGFL